MFREKATNGKKLRVFPTQDGQPSRLRPACSSKPDGFTSWPRVVGLPHGGPRAAAWWVWEKREDGQALGGRVLLARLFIIASQALAVRTGRPPSQGVRGWDPRPACGQRPVESGESSDGSHGQGAVT